jgi:hypothetical protein
MGMGGGLSPNLVKLENLGITIKQATPGDHVPKIERLIQTIKNTVRSLMHSVPVQWPRKVLVGAVLFSVRCFNLMPSETIPDGECAFTRITGVKPNFQPYYSHLLFLDGTLRNYGP